MAQYGSKVILAIKEWWAQPPGKRRTMTQVKEDLRTDFQVVLSSAEITRIATDQNILRTALQEGTLQEALDVAEAHTPDDLADMMARAVQVHALRLAQSGELDASELATVAKAGQTAYQIQQQVKEHREQQRRGDENWRDVDFEPESPESLGKVHSGGQVIDFRGRSGNSETPGPKSSHAGEDNLG